MQRSATVRIGIVDDDVVLREALVRLLAEVPEFDVVAEAGTVAEGRRLLDKKLDVLLIDLGLPDGSGLELIAEAGKKAPACKRIVLSVFGDVRNVVRAVELGADGYLLKGADVAQATDAIRTVLAGGAPISPAVAVHVLSRLRAPESVRGRATPSLTEKETEVLSDLARGFSYKEVAELRGISPHTVGDHVKAIYRKLEVSSRSEAVFEAVQSGLIALK